MILAMSGSGFLGGGEKARRENWLVFGGLRVEVGVGVVMANGIYNIYISLSCRGTLVRSGERSRERSSERSSERSRESERSTERPREIRERSDLIRLSDHPVMDNDKHMFYS